MTEFEYIRSLNDQELAEYILNACNTFALGVLEGFGIQVEDTGVPEDMLEDMIKTFQQPLREPQK